MCLLKFHNHLARMIGGHSIRNDQLHLGAWIGLRKYCIEQMIDGLFFVITRNDDGNKGMHGTCGVQEIIFFFQEWVLNFDLTAGTVRKVSHPPADDRSSLYHHEAV